MKVKFSSLTKPSLKKFAFLVSIFIVFIGGGMALAAHHSTTDNSMPLTHGTGFMLQATTASKLIKVTPSTFNCNSDRPTAACRCQNNDSSFCQCLKSGTGTCTFCLPNHSDFCVTCSVNGSMVACRFTDGDNDNDDHGGVVTPTTSVSGSVGHETTIPPANPTPTTDGSSGGGSSDGSGGNTTGNDNNTPPSASCPTNPHEMYACRAPGNTGGGSSGGGVTSGGGCPYLEVCRAQ